MSKTAERLSQALARKGMKQSELAAITGIGKSSISTYLTGEYLPKQKNLYKMARALDVSEAWLMGVTDDPLPVKSESRGSEEMISVPGLFPVEMKKFPLLGNIACGEPQWAEQDAACYVMAGSNIHADFCLRANGDSMIGARIHDGDIVFIRKQDTVEDGEIAAVLIDNEATLKRVYFDRDAGILTLLPENPLFKTLRYTGEQLNQVRILGKAVGAQIVVG